MVTQGFDAAYDSFKDQPQIPHFVGDNCKPDGHRLEMKQSAVSPGPDPAIRTFASGANRNSDNGKFDFEGFLSPLVLERFAAYMHKNRHLVDGTYRDSDNWQKGMPNSVILKSGLRHMMDWWLLARGYVPVRPEDGKPVDYEEALCGLMFNVMARLYNLLSEGRLKSEGEA